MKENNTPNRRGSKFKVVIKKLKIHKSITKNIFNPIIKKISVRTSKKNIPTLTDINYTPSKGAFNIKELLTVNNNEINILKDKDDDTKGIDIIGSKFGKKIRSEELKNITEDKYIVATFETSTIVAKVVEVPEGLEEFEIDGYTVLGHEYSTLEEAIEDATEVNKEKI